MEFVQAIDQNILLWVVNARDPLLTKFLAIVTHAGDALFIIVTALIACGALFAVKRRYEALVLVVALVLSRVVVWVLKVLVSRDRPDEMFRLVAETGASFPSAHTVGATVFYGTLAYFTLQYVRSVSVKRITVTVLLALILFVGLSRVYLGVHYPSDVFIGFIIGGLFVYLTAQFHTLNYETRLVTRIH